MTEPKTMQIGWASCDITPDRPVNLAGQFHMRISKGVQDPVTATALSVSSKDDAFIWVSCDLVVMPGTVLEKCRAKLKARLPEFPSEKLVVNVTHTHTAPDVVGRWYPPMPPDVMTPAEYEEFLSDRVAEAAAASWRARMPGAVSWGSGYAVLSHNRRAVYSDDLSKRPEGEARPGFKTEKNARMYGDTTDPKFVHLEGSEDHRINILFTFDEQNGLTGAVINQSCPSQVTEAMDVISADFWHEVRLELRKRHGDSLYLLPQCSPAGDLSPHRQFDKKAEQRMLKLKNRTLRQELACRLAAAFDEIYGWVQKDVQREIVLKHSVRTLSLPRRLITDEEYKTAQAGLVELEAMPRGPVGERTLPFAQWGDVLFSRTVRVRQILTRYEEQKTNPSLPVELHVIRVGDVVFATNPFEMFLDYGIRITARSPALQTFLVQLAGGGNGTYLPTQKAQAGESYSACLYCNLVGAEGGAQLVEATLKAMNELWEVEG
jgi:hypothetical protein